MDTDREITILPDFVREAEAEMASGPNPFEGAEKHEEITLKFGKGLVGEPFTSKAGKELVEIKIPNQENDSRPWETFVLPANRVHDNNYGKGVWAKLPADGKTKLSRSLRVTDADGKTSWKRESREVSNQTLKSMVERYKTKQKSAPER